MMSLAMQVIDVELYKTSANCRDLQIQALDIVAGNVMAEQSAGDLRSLYHAIASQAQSSQGRLPPTQRDLIFQLACNIWVSLPPCSC